jgi:uncharacterized Zn finger protein
MAGSFALTEAMIHQLADSQVYSRGRAYFREGAVSGVTRRGELVTAEVEGSDVEPYRVRVKLGAAGIQEAECTCPYDWGGICKHIVAVLLTCLEQPDQIEEAQPLEILLAGVGETQLRTLLTELAEDPGVAARIERRLLAWQTQPAKAAPAAPRVDLASYRRQVKAAMRSARRGGYYDDYGGASEVVAEVNGLLEPVDALLEAGDGRTALTILEAVTEEVVDSVDDLYDDEGEVGNLLTGLGADWTEAILTTDLTPDERKAWASRLGEWHRKAADYIYEGGFEAAQLAAEQGWDFPPLQRVLRGEITERGAWEGEAPGCADELAEARLNVLERQGRLQEYLHLAEAEGQTERYVTMLVRLGRVGDAVEYGLKYLNQPQEALVLAKSLHEHGDHEESLRIAEHGLEAQPVSGVRGGQVVELEPAALEDEEDEEEYGAEDEEEFEAEDDFGRRRVAVQSVNTYELAGRRAELAAWLRDTAVALGQPRRALPAARIVMETRPSLADYQALRQVAGEYWPAIRDEILERLRVARAPYPRAEIEIFLEEGLIDDAIATVDRSPGHEMVEMVAEQAIQARPEWVMKASFHQADRIIEPGKSQYYAEAAQWLARAKKAAIVAGREAEWRAHLEDVLARHQRKYKLVPMLKALL